MCIRITGQVGIFLSLHLRRDKAPTREVTTAWGTGCLDPAHCFLPRVALFQWIGSLGNSVTFILFEEVGP